MKLADAIFSKTQQRLLGLLYAQPGRSFYLKELLRLSGLGVATVKRELDRMVVAGILTRRHVGNQHHYQPDPHCPIYSELRDIVRKTVAIVPVMREALEPLDHAIRQAFIYGSVASGRESSASDIDLLVVGDVSFAELVRAVYPLQETLGREINPRIFATEEWETMLREGDPFVGELMRKPRLDVIGSSHESG